MVRLEDPFIFSVGGEDDRKNVEGLLRAFALLPPDLRAAHQLVVAFGMTEGYRRHLEDLARRLGIARRLYLPGYVDAPTLIRATHLALRRASERPPPTWGQAAEAAVKVYRELLASPPPPARSRGRRRLRVAFVTPLPPQGSGVATYSYRLLEALAPYCEVDAF